MLTFFIESDFYTAWIFWAQILEHDHNFQISLIHIELIVRFVDLCIWIIMICILIMIYNIIDSDDNFSSYGILFVCEFVFFLCLSIRALEEIHTSKNLWS